jgi:nitrogen fixation-related uncharacterized protein
MKELLTESQNALLMILVALSILLSSISIIIRLKLVLNTQYAHLYAQRIK